jgi:hypothetical protein
MGAGLPSWARWRMYAARTSMMVGWSRGGVAHQSLEGVEAAEPHLDLVGAELFDGLGVAIGELAFPA